MTKIDLPGILALEAGYKLHDEIPIAALTKPQWQALQLNLNHRRFWAEKRQRESYWIQAAAVAATAAKRRQLPPATPVRAVLGINITDNINRDSNNLAPMVKAVVDGLVKTGYLPDDSTRYVTGQDTRLTAEPAERYATITLAIYA